MSIKLDKKNGIRLEKGHSILLQKDESPLKEFCVGLNWGGIPSKTFFGLIRDIKAVDLDSSATMFDANGKEIDTVYYGKLTSSDKAVLHSGDDLTGDFHSNDGRDNEVILVKMPRIRPEVQTIVFHLTSYKKQDFALIPYTKIRIYKGTRKYVDQVLCSFNVTADEKYDGKTSMVMAKLTRNGNEWEFATIGEPSEGQHLDEVIDEIQEIYL